MKRLLTYLNYLNPYHWLARLLTWYYKKERVTNLKRAVIEAEIEHKKSGARMVVLNTTEGIIVTGKRDLKKKGYGKLVKKSFYTTR